MNSLNKFTMLCSLYRENRGEKYETEITNYLINLSFTHGMRNNKLINLYVQNGSHLYLSKLI